MTPTTTTTPGPVAAVTGAITSLADARSYTGAALAATGLGLWTLQRYVFHGNLDPVLSAEITALIPGVVGFVAAHITRQATTAPASAPLPPVQTGNVKVLPTQMAPTTQPAPAMPLPSAGQTAPQEGASGPGTS
jgi:hypothetical protein